MKTSKDLSEPIKQLLGTNPLEEAIKSIREAERRLQEECKKNSDKLLQYQENWSKNINNITVTLSENIQSLSNQINKALESAPKYFIILAKYGWFYELNGDVNSHIGIVNQIKKGNIEKVNDYLIDYYSSSFERIITSLKKRHHDRTEVFTEIEKAHNNKQFFVAIPCILSQIDGICYDMFQKYFFINDNKLPAIRNDISSLSNTLLDYFLSPFNNITPIMANKKDLKLFSCSLNRHEIIHGVNKSYGTEINSLKCISLLKFVSYVLIEVKGGDSVDI